MGVAFAIAGATYIPLVALTWYRFGPRSSSANSKGSTLDLFLPKYEVAECHNLEVSVPMKTTFASAINTDLERSMLVGTLFRIRELLFGAVSKKKKDPNLVSSKKQVSGAGGY